jgi:membrane fusion protein (multidrug efflux system)
VSAATTTSPRSPAPEPAAAPAPAAATPARRPMNRKAIGLGAALAVLVLAGGYKWLTWGEESTDDAQVEADVVPLASRVGGQVLHVLVKDNAEVKAGEAIVEIDPAEYAARVKQAEGELVSARAQAEAADAQVQIAEASAKGGFSSARATVSVSNAAVSTADAQVLAAKAAVDRAQAEASAAKIDLQRAEQLYAVGAVPQQALDNAHAHDSAASAALAQAKAQLASTEESKQMALSHVAEAQGQLDSSAPIDSKIAVAHAQAELAHGRVTTAEAALEQARLLLGYTRIVAAQDGRVSKLDVHPGQMVSPGAPIAQLVPSDSYIVANFKEDQIQHMRPGQKVEIELDALDGKLEGTVDSIAAGTGSRFALLPPDNASGNFVKVVQRVPVRIALGALPKGVFLRAGLSADVTVHTK